jgi:general secretion pathway protein G
MRKTDMKKVISNSQRGMNLIEIMVVLVIISLVVGVVGVNVLGQLDKAKMSSSKTQIKQFEEALELYKLSKHRYPSSSEGLNALQGGGGPTDKPFLKDIPNDPWDKPYVYIQPGSHNPDSFDILSYGPDGAEGGGDDIGNWKGAN